jgi:hypothetical protein
MRTRFYVFVGILFFGIAGIAQDSLKQKQGNGSAGVFDSETVLDITITGEVKKLLNDRNTESNYHAVTLTYKEPDGRENSINLKAKCRGHFRKSRENCDQPPILLNFPSNDTVKQSIFRKMDKVKLVTTCTNGDYVLREYLVYQLYELLTEKCFKTRLVNVQFDGEGVRKGDKKPFLGFILEDEEEMAKRCNSRIVDSPMYQPLQTRIEDYLTMTVFQYMVGNVDWSVPYRHNIKTILPKESGLPSVVAYDFDHSGIVDAPYARPPEELGMYSLQQRRYRGICISDMSAYADVLKRFNELKPAFYKIYEETKLVDDSYKKKTLKFLDDFYNTINNEKKLAADFQYPCQGGTSNVNIGGYENKKN